MPARSESPLRVLYRAVSRAERDDIDALRGFRPRPNGRSLEAKLFATSARDAAAYGRANFALDAEPFFLVEVHVSEDVYNDLNSLALDRKTAIVVQTGQYDRFNASLRAIKLLPTIPLSW